MTTTGSGDETGEHGRFAGVAESASQTISKDFSGTPRFTGEATHWSVWSHTTSLCSTIFPNLAGLRKGRDRFDARRWASASARTCLCTLISCLSSACLDANPDPQILHFFFVGRMVLQTHVFHSFCFFFAFNHLGNKINASLDARDSMSPQQHLQVIKTHQGQQFSSVTLPAPVQCHLQCRPMCQPTNLLHAMPRTTSTTSKPCHMACIANGKPPILSTWGWMTRRQT